MVSCRELMEAELRLRGHGRRTWKAYLGCARRLVRHFRRAPETLTSEELRGFLVHLLEEGKVSNSTFNVYCVALRFLYRDVLHRPELWPDIPNHRRGGRLPHVLSREEVHSILQEATNLKHRALLCTLYATGIRLGELVRLRLTDIDSGRMQVRVEQGKGAKDRYTILSPKLLELLRQYCRVMRPRYWLFPGKRAGHWLSESCVQRIFARARDHAGIRKAVSVHTLRHSFATHMLEDGADLLVIQALLGHKSMQSTKIYLHLTNRHMSRVHSPFDGMAIGAPQGNPLKPKLRPVTNTLS